MEVFNDEEAKFFSFTLSCIMFLALYLRSLCLTQDAMVFSFFSLKLYTFPFPFEYMINLELTFAFGTWVWVNVLGFFLFFVYQYIIT